MAVEEIDWEEFIHFDMLDGTPEKPFEGAETTNELPPLTPMEEATNTPNVPPFHPLDEVMLCEREALNITLSFQRQDQAPENGEHGPGVHETEGYSGFDPNGHSLEHDAPSTFTVPLPDMLANLSPGRAHPLPEPVLTTRGEEHNKENEEPKAPTAPERKNVQQVVQARSPIRLPPRELQAVAEKAVEGPPSITLDDSAAAWETSNEPPADHEAKGVKRPRSTNEQVMAAQKAPRRVDKCGLDAGACSHPLTDTPKNNKKHIRSSHDCGIPPDAGTTGSRIGELKYRGKVLSLQDVRRYAVQGALMCTWGSGTPGAAQCGAVFSGNSAQANLERHVEAIHWGREFECDVCERTCNSLRSLARHKASLHGVADDSPLDEQEGSEPEDTMPPQKRRKME